MTSAHEGGRASKLNKFMPDIGLLQANIRLLQSKTRLLQANIRLLQSKTRLLQANIRLKPGYFRPTSG